jgi:hypothetical protein
LIQVALWVFVFALSFLIENERLHTAAKVLIAALPVQIILKVMPNLFSYLDEHGFDDHLLYSTRFLMRSWFCYLHTLTLLLVAPANLLTSHYPFYLLTTSFWTLVYLLLCFFDPPIHLHYPTDLPDLSSTYLSLSLSLFTI